MQYIQTIGGCALHSRMLLVRSRHGAYGINFLLVYTARSRSDAYAVVKSKKHVENAKIERFTSHDPTATGTVGRRKKSSSRRRFANQSASMIAFAAR